MLAACPPCTGFTRTMARNHLHDDQRNILVRRVSQFVRVLRPDIVLLENARELVMGRFSGHLEGLLADLDDLGYAARASTHVLDRFGLPQRRERALVVAARRPLPLHDLAAAWAGWRVSPKATHVRRAIWELPAVAAGAADAGDGLHVSPSLSAASTGSGWPPSRTTAGAGPTCSGVRTRTSC